MIITFKKQSTLTNGTIVFPNWRIAVREKPQSEIKEQIVIKGSNKTTSTVPGTVDQAE